MLLRSTTSCIWRGLLHRTTTVPQYKPIQCTKLQPPTHPSTLQVQRGLRTSGAKSALPPILLMLVSKAGQATAILLGRRFRNLAPEQKAAYIARVRRNRGYLYALLLLTGAGALAYYTTHIEEAPITRRRRFLAFNEEQLDAMAAVELRALLELHRDKLLPATDARHERVFRVALKLIDSNRELLEEYGKARQWTLSLVEDGNMANAFVLSCGSIFVFTGLLELCDEDGPSDSTLAIFLAHELAHVLLSHACEQASVLHLLDAFLIVPFLLLWSLLPSDLTAAGFQWILGRVSDLLFTLPYGRTLETEADEVGLLIAARACFDVRECVIWKKLELRGKEDGTPQIDFLSTHPSGESRYENLSSKLASALALRAECNCPRLPPVMNVEQRIEEYKERLKKKRVQSTELVAAPLRI